MISGTALAVPYYYVDWTQANVAQGTASGTITLPDASQVTVTFAATYANGAHGSLFGAQINGGTNFWSPTTPYTSAQVDNAPPGTDILQLSGGLNQIYTVTLSAAIKDPIMSIVSLGRTNTPTTYDFDSPFTIVSQGPGYFGGTSTSLTQLPGDILRGTEGHGTIQFLGTFSTFSWTVPTPEDWHGFTFGIRTTEAIEPTTVPDQSSTVALLGATIMGLVVLRRRQRQ
ncbi:MAG: VPDSG-CTERM sorting domain-containing protein [Verrucomicrobia bacterium]|nr:VPDSG-CTERM sorting domain-containing protein [Verrucomicrobiota bacterium]